MLFQAGDLITVRGMLSTSPGLLEDYCGKVRADLLTLKQLRRSTGLQSRSNFM
jgi:hypothetical protein